MGAHGMTRVEDWPERLAAFIEQRRKMPFAWGSNDCALFAADAVCAITGVDLGEPFRGRYDDEASLRLHGLHGANAHLAAGDVSRAIRDMATAWLDGEISPKLAQRGDVVLVEHGGGESLAVCDGALSAAPGRRGLVFLPRSTWLSAWKVGRA
jgi:hypothetical protein